MHRNFAMLTTPILLLALMAGLDSDADLGNTRLVTDQVSVPAFDTSAGANAAIWDANLHDFTPIGLERASRTLVLRSTGQESLVDVHHVVLDSDSGVFRWQSALPGTWLTTGSELSEAGTLGFLWSTPSETAHGDWETAAVRLSDGQVIWRHSSRAPLAPAHSNDQLVSKPQLVAGLLLVPDAAGVTALDPLTGRQRWFWPGRPSCTHPTPTPPSGAGGGMTVVVRCAQEVQGLQRDTGQALWTWRPGVDNVITQAAVAERTLAVVATYQGTATISGIDTDSGQQRFHTEVTGSDVAVTATNCAVCTSEMIAVTDHDAVTLLAADGRRVARIGAATCQDGCLHADATRLLVATRAADSPDRTVTAFDPTTWQISWSLAVGAGAVLFDGGNVLTLAPAQRADGRTTLRATAAADGSSVETALGWHDPTLVAAGSGVVYVRYRSDRTVGTNRIAALPVTSR